MINFNIMLLRILNILMSQRLLIFQVGHATSDDDHKADIMTRKQIKLYLCSDEKGSFNIDELKNGPLEQSDLDSNDAFIVDNGLLGIWVWIGKRASKQERTEAMANAQRFVKDKGYIKSFLFIYYRSNYYSIGVILLHITNFCYLKRIPGIIAHHPCY